MLRTVIQQSAAWRTCCEVYEPTVEVLNWTSLSEMVKQHCISISQTDLNVLINTFPCKRTMTNSWVGAYFDVLIWSVPSELIYLPTFYSDNHSSTEQSTIIATLVILVEPNSVLTIATVVKQTHFSRKVTILWVHSSSWWKWYYFLVPFVIMCLTVNDMCDELRDMCE